MSTNPNDPAYPGEGEMFIDCPDGAKRPQSAYGIEGKPGLTKREYFAACAMQGLIQHEQIKDSVIPIAVKAADYLIAELNKTQEEIGK